MTVPAGAAIASEDYLDMSDDDFLNLNSPAQAGEVKVEEPTTTTTPAASEEPKPEVVETEVVEGGDPVTEADGAAVAEGDKEPKPEDMAKVQPEAGQEDKSKAEPKAEDNPKEETKPVDYEAFYTQIMKPFKANGREIKLDSPEEAIRLMQMGAGYGRKLQDMQPHLKVLKLLEKNDLLDQNKLSFLIDLHEGNPEAIKKIVKDSKIDPLDMNLDEPTAYQPRNRSVTDKEMSFHDALATVQSHPTGKETLRHINESWDPESKSALWDQPELIGIIQEQRENGVYDRITAEIDRQKLLGNISHNEPFLKAYTKAGDYLKSTFQGTDRSTHVQNQSGDTQQPQVIATRTGAPKSQVTNSDKAAAASPTKADTSRKAASTVNPLEMADDEFLKAFKGRL